MPKSKKVKKIAKKKTKAKPKKLAVELADKPKVETKPERTLIPQPHGGALWSAGRVGQKGAGGRPPDKLKEMAADGLERALPSICNVAAGDMVDESVEVQDEDGNWVRTTRRRTAEIRDRLKATEFLGKIAGVLVPVSGMKAGAIAGLPDGTVVTLSLGEMTPGDLEDE